MDTPGSLTQQIQQIQKSINALDARIAASRDALLYQPQEALEVYKSLQTEAEDLYSEYEDWARRMEIATGQAGMLANVQRLETETKTFILAQQGQVSLKMGKLDQAQDLFQRALEALGDQPGDFRGNLSFSVGSVMFQRGLFDDAETSFKQAYTAGVISATV